MPKRLFLWLACAGLGLAGLLPMMRAARPPAAPADGAQPLPHPSLAHVEAGSMPLRVEVTGILRVSPDVVELRLAVTNLDPMVPLALGDRFADVPAEAGSLSAAFLTTAEGTARYFVLRDSEGKPVCSTDLEELAAGERREAWVRFTTPDRSAARVTLQIKGMPPLEGLDVPEAS